MVRLIFGIVLAQFFATGAFATGFADPQGRFRVTIPDGWFQTETENPQFAFSAAKLSDTGIDGVCMVQLKMLPQIRSYSQAQIDSEILRDYSKKWWMNGFRNHDYKNVTIVDHGHRRAPTGVVLYVVATASFAVPGTSAMVLMKFREEAHIRTGALHDIACASKPERYDALETEFLAFLSSYESGASLVSGLQPNDKLSALVIYSHAGLTGQQVSLTHDLTTIPPTGWQSRPGSMKVDGDGLWEICEGRNFSGRCQLLSGVYPTPPSPAIVIGSARQPRTFTLERLFAGSVGAATPRAANPR